MENLIRKPEGSTKKKIIVGRGKSARRGGTSGKGNNGQRSRAGGGVRLGFEGGQMPLYRRVAIRGFSNARFKEEYKIVSLSDIDRVYSNGETVNNETLKEKGLIKKVELLVKILSNGEITKKVTVDVDKVSASAVEKIKKAGGSVVSNVEATEAKEE